MVFRFSHEHLMAMISSYLRGSVRIFSPYTLRGRRRLATTAVTTLHALQGYGHGGQITPRVANPKRSQPHESWTGSSYSKAQTTAHPFACLHLAYPLLGVNHVYEYESAIPHRSVLALVPLLLLTLVLVLALVL